MESAEYAALSKDGSAFAYSYVEFPFIREKLIVVLMGIDIVVEKSVKGGLDPPRW